MKKRILSVLALVAIIPALTACPAATFSVSIPFGDGSGKNPVGAFNYAGTIPGNAWPWQKTPVVVFTPETPETPPAVVTPATKEVEPPLPQ